MNYFAPMMTFGNLHAVRIKSADAVLVSQLSSEFENIVRKLG